jgi:exo-1,4-beta-D-glucosaminidase
VAVRFPAVATRLNPPANDVAHLTVKAELKNAANQAVDGVLKGKIEGLEFSQPVRLGPGETRVVRFTPELAHPRLWWPAQMGTPNLYDLALSFEMNGEISDQSRARFGIREITSEVAEQAPDRFKRLFRINGKKILIRGGGWTPDMMMRETPERLADEFRYVRDLGLNTVRLEGKLETEEFFEMADSRASWSWPDGAVAISGSIGGAGRMRTSKSPRPPCATRCIACEVIPVW